MQHVGGQRRSLWVHVANMGPQVAPVSAHVCDTDPQLMLCGSYLLTFGASSQPRGNEVGPKVSMLLPCSSYL